MVDYYFAKRGNIHVPSLYNGNKDGIYYYTYGTNWRGVFAWCGAVSFGLPGLIGTYVPSAVGQAAKNMYKMGWLLTFVVGGVLYASCILIWPTQTYPEGYGETPKSWEYMGARDGFFDGERDGSIGESEGTNSLEVVQTSFDEKADAKV
jgi:NCS1 family nucleobase:cation symporter-1